MLVGDLRGKEGPVPVAWYRYSVAIGNDGGKTFPAMPDNEYGWEKLYLNASKPYAN